MTPTLHITAPAAAFVAAVAVVAFALRGRRADDHPHCRKCGFDLFGKPPDAAVCSECGADLARRRAIRTGRRERRRRVLAAAVPALLVAGGWLGFRGWAAARGVDWDRHKPVWWLAADAGDARHPTRRDVALAELTRRLTAGELTTDQLAKVADRGLAYQADDAAPWVPAWGEWLEKAHDAGRLPGDRWHRYARQAVRPQVILPAAVRRGDPLSVTVCPVPARMAGGRYFITRIWLKAMAVDGVPVAGLKAYGPDDEPDEGAGGWCGCVMDGVRRKPWLDPAPVPPAVLAALADGPHTVRCQYRLEVSGRGNKAAPPVDETVVLDAAFTLLPADAPAVMAGRDDDAGQDRDPG